MIFKRKDPKADPRRNAEKLIGGRRTGENENPYLSARRTWKDHTQGVISTRQAWQVMGILSMLVAWLRARWSQRALSVERCLGLSPTTAIV